MAASISGRARELLEDKNFCHVSTLRDDGTILGVVVWAHPGDDRVYLNSAEGRTWPANVRRDPRVTLTIWNRENPYEFASVRGRVVEMTHDGADEHIDSLAKKYLDQDTYPFRQPGEQRIKIAVEPEWVTVQGG